MADFDNDLTGVDEFCKKIINKLDSKGITEFDKDQVRDIITAYGEVVTDETCKGATISHKGFGTWRRKVKKARRVILRGVVYEIPNRVVSFFEMSDDLYEKMLHDEIPGAETE